MIVCMSKLEFFFNRPTLVALIGFGLDLSAANGGSSVPDEEKTPNEDLLDDKIKIKDSGDTFVKGLLGYGKGRALFCLNVNVDSVIVCLNKEDGSQLAMFVQESFVLDLKVKENVESAVFTCLVLYPTCDTFFINLSYFVSGSYFI